MSLKEELSLYWTRLHEGLFPRLEAMVGSLTPLYKKLVTVLELARLETFLPDSYPLQHPVRGRRTRLCQNPRKLRVLLRNTAASASSDCRLCFEKPSGHAPQPPRCRHGPAPCFQ